MIEQNGMSGKLGLKDRLAGFAAVASLVAVLQGCGGANTPSVAPPVTPAVPAVVITTVAGNNRLGYSGDGGAATAAQLYDPTCVTFDSSGNLYIGDLADNVVRRVDTAGIITTYAGTGIAGYTGDGGQATQARMYGPTSCVVDKFGNLYIADDANNAVRKVNATTHIITTVVGNGVGSGTSSGAFSGDGGLAAAASINHPFGIALDASGNLYVADTLNYRVRRVDAVTGIITTVAGNGQGGYAGDGGAATFAKLYNPEGLALDTSGNLFIAEQANGTVRRVDARTGVISTIAGIADSNTVFSGDDGPATSAHLQPATGLAFSATGDLYIADTGHDRIRKVTMSTGIISLVAGNGISGFSGDGSDAQKAELWRPNGITFDTAGSLYVADYVNGVVRKITFSK